MKEQDRRTAEGILYTDEYQITMAQMYFRAGLHERRAQFDHFFRSYPDYDSHKAGYCVNAGLEWLLDWMADASFREEDIGYLRQTKGRTGKQLFGEDFLKWLKDSSPGFFNPLTIRAIPEGRVVHPNTPITVVEGPLAIAQILETSLLSHLNYQTLVATKAARIHDSARGQMVMEFGLRRGQEKGANAGARAALIGGVDYTSNVGISHVLGLPPKGTHAHSMVQVFMSLGMSELTAFRAFADVYPDDCTLLVDTIDTLESGVPNAIAVFEELRRKGHEPGGIRMDSGDLAYLSIRAARMLNDAGFPNVSIVLSNDLDELVIWQIITQITEEASRYGVDADHLITRLVYGVGTRLITSWGEPALGGVYKLVAVQDGATTEWHPAIKISESSEKTPNPGTKNVWRLYDQRCKATADLICLADEDPRTMPRLTLRHPSDHAKIRILEHKDMCDIEPLLVDVYKDGVVLNNHATIADMRARRQADVDRLDAGVKRLVNPHIYHVSLTERLWNLKQDLIRSAMQSSH